MSQEQSAEELSQEIDALVQSFSKSLQEHQERIAAELILNEKKKQKITKEKARVAVSPQLLVNKIKKNFNKAKIAVMKQANNLSFKYGEYQEAKSYSREQKMADRLQAQVEKERIKERKADFKAALKLHLKEERKIKINQAKDRVIVMPFVLMNSLKKNFNKTKIAIMRKANDLSYQYSEYRDNKSYLRDQKMADRLQEEVEEERLKERKADFKAAIKEHSRIARQERKIIRKQKISASLSYLTTLPQVELNKVKSGLSRMGNGILNKYGELYAELEDRKEERMHIKNLKNADQIQEEYEKERLKDRKSEFKAAIKNEKMEERKRRHQAILDMIKTLDEEQKQELQAQKEEIFNLQSKIMYNLSETGGRKR